MISWNSFPRILNANFFLFDFSCSDAEIYSRIYIIFFIFCFLVF